MSDVIRIRAAMVGQRALEDIRTVLSQIYSVLADGYTKEEFEREIDSYLKYAEMKFSKHDFKGIVFKGDEDKAPDVENIFVLPQIAPRHGNISFDKAMDDISALFARSPYWVLLGRPGAGKSMLTRYMTWIHAKANLMPSAISTAKNPGLLSGKPVPLRIELRLLSEARKKQNCGFLSYASEVMLKEEDISIHTQMFIELLERKVMLVLFDGLDEVPSLSERQQLVEQIELFAQRYPGNYIMVTSRPVGYDLARLADPPFIHGSIQDFSDEQISAFLEKWYTYILKFPSLVGDVRRELDTFYGTLQNNLRLHNLATNPLLLTVMATLYHYKRLPDKRVDLYKECADLLLDTWAKLKYKERRFKDMKMGQLTQRDCLAHLGLFLHTRSQEEQENENDRRQEGKQSEENTAIDVPAEEIQREIERFLKSENLLSGAEIRAEAERFLNLIKTEAGLIVERGTDEKGPLYGFVHLTFQEYFASVAVYGQYEQGEDRNAISDFLEAHLHDPHWNEVILLLLGQLRHKQLTALLRRLLTGEIKSHRSKYTEIVQQDLFFICKCLAEDIIVEQAFAEEVISQIGNLVKKSSFPSQRDQALEMFDALVRTQQYGSLVQRKLMEILTEDSIVDIRPRMQVAQILYKNSPNGSNERHLVLQKLLAFVQQPAHSFTQALEAVSSIDILNRDGILLATQMFLALAQRPDLSIEKTVPIAQYLANFNKYYYTGEEKNIRQVLLTLVQQPIRSVEERLQLANVLYHISDEDSNEMQLANEVILNIMHASSLSFEQQLQVAETLYDIAQGELAEKMLLSLVQQTNLPKVLSLQAAATLYRESQKDSTSKQIATQTLSYLVQTLDLPFEQAVRIIDYLYEAGSEIRSHPAAQWHLTLAHRSNLSFEEQLEAVHVLNKISERERGVQLLLALVNEPNLSFEQHLRVAELLYRYSSNDSDEEQIAKRTLLALAENQDLTSDQRLLATTIPLIVQNPSYYENIKQKYAYHNRVQAMRIVGSLIEKEVARQFLEEYWEPVYSEVKVSDIPYIAELVQQELLSIEARDGMYQKLWDMVSQFDKVVVLEE